MKTYEIGLLRVLTPQSEALLHTHANLLKEWFPQFVIESRCIPNNPEGLASEEAKAKGIPDVIRIAEDWQGIDGLIISCADDPAVEFLQTRLPFPVTGAGASAAILASLHRGRIGVIGIEEKVPPNILNQVQPERYCGYVKPEAVVDSNSLQTEDADRVLKTAVNEIKNMGASIVLSACTGLSVTNFREIVQKAGLTYVDALYAAGWAMLGLLGSNT